VSMVCVQPNGSARFHFIRFGGVAPPDISPVTFDHDDLFELPPFGEAETRKQKHDRRDARLILDLLTRTDGFPEIWMPSIEQRDLRTLLRDRHQWVKMRTRVQNTLQALNHALRRGRGLWTAAG
jgi:hypothetical protein